MYVTSDQICTGLRYLSIGTCLRECVAAKCEIKVVCSKQWHKTAHIFVVLWERKKNGLVFSRNTQNRVEGLRSAVAPQDQVQMFSSPDIRCFISHSSRMMDAGLSRTFCDEMYTTPWRRLAAHRIHRSSRSTWWDCSCVQCFLCECGEATIFPR
uniref:Uncharacterized protein n=1 Tax=Rhipicephalus microplus TaxID=6941 RepID=A0A6G5AFG3_RHIMP